MYLWQFASGIHNETKMPAFGIVPPLLLCNRLKHALLFDLIREIRTRIATIRHIIVAARGSQDY
jgi:hypothetical protein